jgi:hypothetical protein
VGNDYHYHGDPFGNKCLYNEKNVSDNHPTIYGYSLDGVAIYGKYTSVNQVGESIDLDDCGGHSHEPYGYHYHSKVHK